MNKLKKRITTKSIISIVLAIVMAFSSFFSILFDNILLSDYIDFHNLIVANAAISPVPLFYRYGELVGLYRLNYNNNTTIQYKIGENGTWTNYTVPFTIPAFSPDDVTVYARFGTDGAITYDDFNTTNKAIGVYTESATDFDFSYNGIDFGYTRIYNSADKDWFESIHSKVVTVGSYLKVFLPDGTEYPLIRTGDNTYVDQITGNTLNKINSEYVFDDGEYKYHFAINALNSIAYLSGIEDNNGNTLNLTRTINSEQASISDSTRTFALSDYHSVEATNDPDVQYYSVKTITDPNGNDIEYTTKWRRYIQLKDQAGVTLGNYQYVSTANDYTLTKSNDKSLEYYANGRIKKITYDNGSWLQYTYTDIDKTYTTLSSTGETTCTVYNDAFLPVSYTDEYGTTTTYTYDSKYRVLTETTDNEVTTYTYDSSGHILTMTVVGGEDNTSTTYTYDNNGNVVREQCDDSYTYYTYDSNKNVLVSATLKEDYEGEIPSAYNSNLTCFDTITYTYDNSGRVLTETYSTGEANAYVYDTAGNITQETVTTVENNTPTTTVTNYTYDSMGNLLTTQTGNENESYIYDAAGRTLLANEGGECTRTLYDSLGRVVQEIAPEDYDSSLDGLPTENSYSDSTVGHRYVYDSTTGNLTSETNRLDVQTVYTYHSTGEKATEEFDIYKFCYNTKGLTTNVYIDNVNTVNYNYDEDDTTLLSTEYANGQKERFAYNNAGLLQYQYHNNDSTPYLTYTYNNDGELTEKTNSDTGLRYVYSGDNVSVYKTSNNTLIHSYTEQITEANEELETEAHTDVTQSNFGTTTTSTLAGNSISYTAGNNTLEYSHTDNDDYQITADEVEFNNSSILNCEYEYNSNGNVSNKTSDFTVFGDDYETEIENTYNANYRKVQFLHDNLDVKYYYDDKGQVVRVDDTFNDYCKHTYTYDSRGNITAKKRFNYSAQNLEIATPTETTNFTYSSSGWTDRLTAVNNDSLTYDAVGNVLTFGSRSFTWSNGRCLAQVSEGNNTYSYKYDENGIRTSKTVNGTTTQYNTKDGVILAQSDGTNTMTFQYDTSGQPLGYTYNGAQYIYYKDADGIILGVLDSAGDAIASYYYDAWGKLLDTMLVDEEMPSAIEEAVYANPILYKGYYYDFETGYYYLQSRYYDPEICRFINADLPEIAQQSKDNYVGLDIFAYCDNDPINNSDPTGYKYSPKKAKKYADKWWWRRNTKKYKTNCNDCANFVSQCLYAGKLSHMTGIIGSSKGWHHYHVGGKFQISDAWGKASNLFRWLKTNHCRKIVSFSGKYKKSNLNKFLKKNYSSYKYCKYAVFFDWDCRNSLGVSHAALSGELVKNSNNYELYYYSHTSNRAGRKRYYEEDKYTSHKHKLYNLNTVISDYPNCAIYLIQLQ